MLKLPGRSETQKNKNFSYLAHVKNFSGFSKFIFLVFMGFQTDPKLPSLQFLEASRTGLNLAKSRLSVSDAY